MENNVNWDLFINIVQNNFTVVFFVIKSLSIQRYYYNKFFLANPVRAAGFPSNTNLFSTRMQLLYLTIPVNKIPPTVKMHSPLFAVSFVDENN